MPGSVSTSLARGLLVAALIGGCTSNDRPILSLDPGAKAGGNAGPIVITVADSQARGKPTNLPLDAFKRQVESRPEQGMTVEIAADAAADSNPPHSDAAVIEAVRSGAYDMAVIPARAWSAEGVTSMQALQAPFLFESDAHVAAAVRDPSISDDLLSGLGGEGVTGLVLFPAGLRHLFSHREPFLAPADVAGKTIRAISSLESTAMIEALGAKAVDVSDEDYRRMAFAEGTIHGFDSSFVLVTGLENNANTTATGDVTLYAKVMSLVVNSAFWDGLSHEQQQTLHDAAVAAQAWAITHQQPDAKAADAFCEGGGRVVLAGSRGLRLFREAEEPVYAKLEQDPVTKHALESVAALAGHDDAPRVKACQPSRPVVEPEGGDLPDGIYHVEATEGFIRSRYPTFYPNAVGLYTYYLDDGEWSFDYESPSGELDHESATYRVDGDRVRWLFDPTDSIPNQAVDARWSVEPDGTLHFTQLTGAPEWTMELPFIRVGDLPSP